MQRLMKWSWVVVAASCGFVSSALGAQVTETFTANTDTYWDKLDNRTSPQNYGWSNTDNTGTAVNPPGADGIPGNADDGVATGAGEFGGIISRNGPHPNFYGFNVGSINPATQGFTVSGVIRSNAGTGALFLGYSQGAASYADVNGDLANFIGILLNDGKDVFGFDYTHETSPGSRHRTGQELPTLDLPIGVAVPFGMQYTPQVGATLGTLRVSVGANSATATFENGFPGITDALNHFGVFPQRNALTASEIYMDDLTFTSDNPIPPIPEPASLGLLGLGAVMAMRRGVRRD
jgi:hypothetical protein